MSANEAARAAAQKRSSSVSKTPSGAKTATTQKGGEKYYSGDSGIKVQPKTVLIISLVYMGIVLLLHIFGKLRGSSVPLATESGATGDV